MRKTITINAITLNDTVNKYALIGLLISIATIIIATCIVSFNRTGLVTVEGLLMAQLSNPAIWALDLTPFMFAYWGQSYCYTLAKEAEEIIDSRTNSFQQEAKKLNKQLLYEKNIDRITELPNYTALCERIDTDVIKIRAECLIIVLKINNFKEINYCLGDIYTDNLLMLFVKKLKKMLLEIYVLQSHNGKSLVARMRHDEFAILLPGFKQLEEVSSFLDYVSNYIENSLSIDEHIKINASITLGAASHPKHGSNAKELIQHATDSIDFAKKDGVQYKFFKNKITQNFIMNGLLISKLEDALSNKEYKIEYLPHFNLKTNTIIGVEARIDFTDKNLNIINTKNTLLMSIEFEVIKKINFIIMSEMVKQLASWQKKGATLYGQLNISQLDCRNNELSNYLSARLKYNKVPAEQIALSISERKIFLQQLMCPKLLNQLAKLGTQITIDDFSKEQSPLKYLSQFRVKNVLVSYQDLEQSSQDNANKFILSILKIADIFNFQVVVKGISDQKTLNALKELGCTIGRGDFLSEKLSAEELENQLINPRV